MSVLASLLARAVGRWYFRHQLAAALRRHGLSLAVIGPAWQPLYERWLSGGRRAQPAMLARALLPQEAPASWDVASQRLLPLIAARPSDRIVDASLQPWAQALGLSLDIGLSTGPAGSRVLLRDLQQWGVSGEQALQCAVQNLARFSSPRLGELRAGLLHASWQDDFDSARLLLPGLLQQWPLDGVPLALVTARSLLLAGGEGRTLDAALAAELEATQRHRPQAAELLFWQRGCWRPWQPGAHWPQLRLALDRLQLAAWERQKQRLDQLAACGDGLPAAAVHVLPARGRQCSACSWVNGVSTLLPATDLVLLVSDADDFSRASVHRWQDVLAQVGHYLQPCGLQPERWRVTGFPSLAELAALPSRHRSM